MAILSRPKVGRSSRVMTVRRRRQRGSTAASGDWRAQLNPGARERIVNKIMDTLQRHLPIYGREGLGELRKIARRFEEKICTAAKDQSDYLRKISLKMLVMETKTQYSGVANQMPSNPSSENPPDQVSTSFTTSGHS